LSYEGYSQLICPNSHLWTVDCNIEGDRIKDNKCPICKKQAIFRNMVDLTNGSFEDGERID